MRILCKLVTNDPDTGKERSIPGWMEQEPAPGTRLRFADGRNVSRYYTEAQLHRDWRIRTMDPEDAATIAEYPEWRARLEK